MKDLGWFPRCYLPGYGHAHLLAIGGSLNSREPSLCGLTPGVGWFGSGAQTEIEFLAGLPTCGTCLGLAEHPGRYLR